MQDHVNTWHLKDLGELVASTKASVQSFAKPAEFGISAAFADSLPELFPGYAFEFYDRSMKVRTPGGQCIYVSSQSFAVSVCLMDFCEEIGKYRAIAYRVLNRNEQQLNSIKSGPDKLDERVFKELRDGNARMKAAFKEYAHAFFIANSADDEASAAVNADRLIKFLTDYDWWLGGKNISRGNDWAISPISTLLNMPQNDSNFIARVVSKATEDSAFREHFKQAIEREWEYDTTDADAPAVRSSIAENILLYGVPGCGKSHTIKTKYCNDDDRMERAVFHPDYTYSDFVGQILPRIDGGRVEYRFVPGPFTRILKKAVETPTDTFYLVVEEINRGNAPAIFGDIFQLLDRDVNGCSEYGVSNENVAGYIYGCAEKKIKIPGNLYVLATMNTSDQNVFTLDTAFKRRWTMKMIENNIDACDYADTEICSYGVTWGTFAKTINAKITALGENNLSNEDNRLGAYFVKEPDLKDAARFGEKVLMYLWNDAFKFDRDKVFKPEYRTLDELLTAFCQDGFNVFGNNVVFERITTEQTSEPENRID